MPDKPSHPTRQPGDLPVGYSFGKKERLRGKALISSLFSEGRSIQTSAFTVYYLDCNQNDTTARVAVSVPRRLFRKAVHRNLLKRRIRESYRLYKPAFYEQLEAVGRKVCLVIIYRKKEISDFHSIQKDLKSVLQLVVRELLRPRPAGRNNT